MRCFIAVDIPDNLRKELVKIQEELKSIIHAKWVEEENLHITIKFLGEIFEEQKKKVIEVLKNLEFRRFIVKLKGIGCFPNEDHPRVIWVGVSQGKEELEKLFEYIDKNTRDIRIEDKGYVPHVTLGRVKFVKDRERWLKFYRKNCNIEIGEFVVDKIKLKKSVLTPNGPIYTDIFVKELT